MMRAWSRHPGWWFAAWLLWFAAVYVSSSLPGMGGGGPVLQLDKLAHFLSYAAGGLLLAGGLCHLRPDRPDWRVVVCVAVLLTALTGLFDEWHQSFTPHRNGLDPWDWLADILGGTAGALLIRVWYRRL
jgi:VanZ family protein